MSFSALAGQASTLLGAVSQLFGGAGSVTLGSVVFSGIEVPHKLTWGGQQRLASQVQPGGIVNLSGMGIVYPPITWNGIFEGFSALTRSREVYAIMNAAAPVSLSWNDRLYTVMVETYTADDEQPNWIPYRVFCRVLRDETLSGAQPTPSLLAQVQGDLTSAVGITPSDMADVSGALGQAQTAAGALGAVTLGSGASLALAGAVGSAQGIVGGELSGADGGMGAIMSVAASGGDGVFPFGGAGEGASVMAGALASAENLASLPIVSGFLGRVATNLSGASA